MGQVHFIRRIRPEPSKILPIRSYWFESICKSISEICKSTRSPLYNFLKTRSVHYFCSKRSKIVPIDCCWFVNTRKSYSRNNIQHSPIDHRLKVVKNRQNLAQRLVYCKYYRNYWLANFGNRIANSHTRFLILKTIRPYL